MNKSLDLLIDDEISKAAFYQLLKEPFPPLYWPGCRGR